MRTGDRLVGCSGAISEPESVILELCILKGLHMAGVSGAGVWLVASFTNIFCLGRATSIYCSGYDRILSDPGLEDSDP